MKAEIFHQSINLPYVKNYAHCSNFGQQREKPLLENTIKKRKTNNK